MRRKKKAVLAVASSGGDRNVDKLFVHHLNTPFLIGQSISPKLTGVYSENQNKENQCFHCENYFAWLPFGAVDLEHLLGVYVGICKGCISSLSILPPNLQKGFWRKVERNLKNTLGVKADV